MTDSPAPVARPIDVLGGELGEFAEDVSARLDRLQLASPPIPIEAVTLREDVLPELTSWIGYPVIRLAHGSPVRWGVLT